MKPNKDLMGLMVRYGLVGIVATIIHSGIALMMHEWLGVDPFWSHAAGFCGGLISAYFGHYHYSFKDDGAHKNRFPKFVISSLVGFGLHQGGVLVLVNQFQLDYSTQALPLLMVAVPALTFLMSKFWVFR